MVREATSEKCCGNCLNFNLRPGMAHSGDGTCLALASRFVHERFVCDLYSPVDEEEPDAITPSRHHPSRRLSRRPQQEHAQSRAPAPPVVDLRKFFD
jgi:hypothetical protein